MFFKKLLFFFVYGILRIFLLLYDKIWEVSVVGVINFNKKCLIFFLKCFF